MISTTPGQTSQFADAVSGHNTACPHCGEQCRVLFKSDTYDAACSQCNVVAGDRLASKAANAIYNVMLEQCSNPTAEDVRETDEVIDLMYAHLSRRLRYGRGGRRT